MVDKSPVLLITAGRRYYASSFSCLNMSSRPARTVLVFCSGKYDDTYKRVVSHLDDSIRYLVFLRSRSGYMSTRLLLLVFCKGNKIFSKCKPYVRMSAGKSIRGVFGYQSCVPLRKSCFLAKENWLYTINFCCNFNLRENNSGNQLNVIIRHYR